VKETDLYQPIHDYLVKQGYAVQAEVNHCDIIASKSDDLIVIELKTRFGLDLLMQATQRQSITDSVYVAIPGPIKMSKRSRWPQKKRLLRQLELGLILVHLNLDEPWVEVAFHPLPYQRRKLKRKKRAVLNEMSLRSGSYNKGGSTKKKLVTAYRENALFIACCLDKFGALTPAQLRAMNTGPKTGSVLSSNFYDWFQRVERGVYALSAQGKTDLKNYPELRKRFSRQLRGVDAPSR
jgi:hypothetical protein